MPLRAHPIPGTAQVRWKMIDANGHEFFPDSYPAGLLMTIVVRDGVPAPNLARLI